MGKVVAGMASSHAYALVNPTGWEAMRQRTKANYKRRYPTRDKMGRVKFSELEVTLMEDSVALVLGRWRLKRAKDSPHGRFTLIFKHLPEGWRVLHDHTSVAPLPR